MPDRGAAGIEPLDLPFILDEARRSPFAGSALAIGGGALDNAEAAATFADFGLPAPASSSLPDILRAIGFAQSNVVSDPGVGLDGKQATGQFDTVFDLGASMRVFQVRRILAALGQRVAVGGRIVHAVPSANHMDQGFYMASPRLFHDYYRANKWRLESLMLVCRAHRGAFVEGISYTPGSLQDVAHGGLDDRRYRVFCVATRLVESTTGLVPQHGMYVDAWKRGAVFASDQPTASNPVADWMRRTRWAYRIVNRLTAARKKRQIRAACLTPVVRHPLRAERD